MVMQTPAAQMYELRLLQCVSSNSADNKHSIDDFRGGIHTQPKAELRISGIKYRFIIASLKTLGPDTFQISEFFWFQDARFLV